MKRKAAKTDPGYRFVRRSLEAGARLKNAPDEVFFKEPPTKVQRKPEIVQTGYGPISGLDYPSGLADVASAFWVAEDRIRNASPRPTNPPPWDRHVLELIRVWRAREFTFGTRFRSPAEQWPWPKPNQQVAEIELRTIRGTVPVVRLFEERECTITLSLRDDNEEFTGYDDWPKPTDAELLLIYTRGGVAPVRFYACEVFVQAPRLSIRIPNRAATPDLPTKLDMLLESLRRAGLKRLRRA